MYHGNLTRSFREEVKCYNVWAKYNNEKLIM